MKAPTWKIVLLAAFIIFIALSFHYHFALGEDMGRAFFTFATSMVLILPPAFALIGLFEVWIDREAVEKAFGSASGFMGYLWSLLLAATTTGGAYVAFPVAHTLYRKGAAYHTLLIYVGASAILRIPMTIFEATFLGLKFTVIRYAVSLPLLLMSSVMLGEYLKRRGYELPDLEAEGEQ